MTRIRRRIILIDHDGLLGCLARAERDVWNALMAGRRPPAGVVPPGTLAHDRVMAAVLPADMRVERDRPGVYLSGRDLAVSAFDVTIRDVGVFEIRTGAPLPAGRPVWAALTRADGTWSMLVVLSA